MRWRSCMSQRQEPKTNASQINGLATQVVLPIILSSLAVVVVVGFCFATSFYLAIEWTIHLPCDKRERERNKKYIYIPHSGALVFL